MGFGTPKYGRDRKKVKSLSSGDRLVVRILPPIHSCADTGEWAVSHAQHFGYKTKSPSDSERDLYNNFYCIEEVRWDNGKKRVTKACPECELIASRKLEYDSQRVELERQGKSREVINETLRPLTNWQKAHTREFKWYLNVKDASGDFFTIRIPHKLKTKVDALIKKYREEAKPAIDIIAADQGLWLALKRTGDGINTEYDVEVVRESSMQNGEFVEKMKRAPLTDADAENAEARCYDLHDVGIHRLSLDKIKMLTSCGGDESTINAIFRSAERQDVAPATARVQAPVVSPPPAMAKQPPAPVAEVRPAKPAPVLNPDEDPKVKAALEALAQARAAASRPATAAPVAATPSVAPAANDDMDTGDSPEDEAFYAQFREA